eukprot:614168-Rhodomonas_salina.1
MMRENDIGHDAIRGTLERALGRQRTSPRCRTPLCNVPTATFHCIAVFFVFAFATACSVINHSTKTCTHAICFVSATSGAERRVGGRWWTWGCSS